MKFNLESVYARRTASRGNLTVVERVAGEPHYGLEEEEKYEFDSISSSRTMKTGRKAQSTNRTSRRTGQEPFVAGAIGPERQFSLSTK